MKNYFDFKNKNVLTLDELDSKEIEHLLELGIELKKQQKKGHEKPILQNKTLAMIFEKPSTRTRVSFEVGMLQLGGHAITLSSDNLQMSRGETISDTAKALSRYVDVIMARVYDHDILDELSNQKKNTSDEIDYSKWGLIETTPLNKIKQTTGKNMSNAWSTIPQVTQFDSADISNLYKSYTRLKKENSNPEIKVSLIPFYIKIIIFTIYI